MNRNFIAFAALPFLLACQTANAAPKAKLPLVVYNEGGNTNVPYAPSGFMGDTKLLRVNWSCTQHPHSGATCAQISFLGKDWTGVVWQNPPNDWGTKPGGLNLTGARQLTFWARGEKGGELADFKFGILAPTAKFHDTATGELKTTLTKNWKQYTISLKGKNLSDIKTGFCFVLAGKPATFYLDDVKYQ